MLVEMIDYTRVADERMCVNHSTYHSGQIASLLKADDIVPPATDLIILKRDMLL